MLNKNVLKELIRDLERLCYDILDKVIAPTCGLAVGGVWADILLAKLTDYTDSKKELQKVVQLINERYKTDISVYRNEPLVILAFVIYINGIIPPEEWENENNG